MTTIQPHETVTTDQLHEGDIVRDHELRLLIDQPWAVYRAADGDEQTVPLTYALILNWDEMVSAAAEGDLVADAIVVLAQVSEAGHRWPLRGDRDVQWTRELAA